MNRLRSFRVDVTRQKSRLNSSLSGPTPSLTRKRQVGTSSLSDSSRSGLLRYHSLLDQSEPSSFQHIKNSVDQCFLDRAELASHIPKSVRTEIMTPMATVDSIHDPKTGTWQYIAADHNTLDAVIVDPVMDFDGATQTVSTDTADRLVSLVKTKGYRILRILETHVHADHVTAASYLQSIFERDQGSKPPVCIGSRIRDVQQLFGPKYGVPAVELSSAFDQLLEDDEVFSIGDLQAKVIHLPGHTPDHIGYMIGGDCPSLMICLLGIADNYSKENVFCGDSVFNADLGTARCDFPGGSSKALYQSTRNLLSLPSHYKIWTGHDYPSPERQCPVPYMSVEDQKQRNRYLRDDVSEQTFQEMRNERDACLGEPKLLHPSLQINIRGGRLPKPSPQGEYFLRLPLRFGNVRC